MNSWRNRGSTRSFGIRRAESSLLLLFFKYPTVFCLLPNPRMSFNSSSSSSSSGSGPTNGVLHPALTLLREDFDVSGARRAHSRFIDTSTNQPRWFAQHRRTVPEAALFHGRDKVSGLISLHLDGFSGSLVFGGSASPASAHVREG